MKEIFGDNRGLAWLAWSLIVVALVGAVFALTVFVNTGVNDGVFSSGFCLRDECIATFSQRFASVLSILSVTGALLGGLITFGGIAIALMSYVGTAKASALNNHIAHMAIFTNYVYSEVDKRDRLSRTSFDVLKWYNLIYKSSRVGNVYISTDYKIFMGRLNATVKDSNELVSKINSGGYRYKKHQQSIMRELSAAGIILKSLPRLDFHEVEGQVFDLVKAVNESFCQSADGLNIVERNYL